MNEVIESNTSQGSALSPQLLPAAETWQADETLKWAYEKYADKVAIASAFGVEGIALIDIAARVWPRLQVFVLDTSFLFPETHRLIEQMEERYGLSVERIRPALTPDAQALVCGPELWKSNPDLCCYVRKIEPLRRKLSTLQAWVTSIRREQTPDRQGVGKIEWDARFQLVKINPLADWSQEQVWHYVRTRKLPHNPLHDEGYPSIGCTHCTRAVRPGEEPRAGRWPGWQKRECGLHARTQQAGCIQQDAALQIAFLQSE